MNALYRALQFATHDRWEYAFVRACPLDHPGAIQRAAQKKAGSESGLVVSTIADRYAARLNKPIRNSKMMAPIAA